VRPTISDEEEVERGRVELPREDGAVPELVLLLRSKFQRQPLYVRSYFLLYLHIPFSSFRDCYL